ncbi:MAG: hypothetical protein COB20_06860 [SAR86 cluster bacterium]|uniref:Lipocalin-like domain-containing protein n=1 Tax=SAR86 cluster bacterium TaxID=2030880 RepID=A0A2A4X6H4_9GAMM|nr:MAG: hypothetical protein COB20_06860 [SAR86 cluster bacterium]
MHPFTAFKHLHIINNQKGIFMKNRTFLSLFVSVMAGLILSSCVSQPNDPLVGVWNVDLETPIGASSQVWRFTEDGKGEFESDLGSSKTDDISLIGKTLMFTIYIDAGGQDIEMNFDGTIEEGSITGQFASEFGEFSVTGARQ